MNTTTTRKPTKTTKRPSQLKRIQAALEELHDMNFPTNILGRCNGEWTSEVSDLFLARLMMVRVAAGLVDPESNLAIEANEMVNPNT